MQKNAMWNGSLTSLLYHVATAKFRFRTCDNLACAEPLRALHRGASADQCTTVSSLNYETTSGDANGRTLYGHYTCEVPGKRHRQKPINNESKRVSSIHISRPSPYKASNSFRISDQYPHLQSPVLTPTRSVSLLPLAASFMPPALLSLVCLQLLIDLPPDLLHSSGTGQAIHDHTRRMLHVT